MNDMKKKMMAVVAGAMVAAASLPVFAAGYGNGPMQGGYGDGGRGYCYEQRMDREVDYEKMASRIAEDFGLDKDEILSYMETEEHRPFMEMRIAFLAKASGKSFAEVADMKNDGNTWRDVVEELSLTTEKMRATQESLMVSHIVKNNSNSYKESDVKALLANGYHPMDIIAAGALAKAANVDAKSVLDKKKINNRWQDVAKEMNIDASVLDEAFHPYWAEEGMGYQRGRGGRGMGYGMMGGPGMMGGSPMMDEGDWDSEEK